MESERQTYVDEIHTRNRGLSLHVFSVRLWDERKFQWQGKWWKEALKEVQMLEYFFWDCTSWSLLMIYGKFNENWSYTIKQYWTPGNCHEAAVWSIKVVFSGQVLMRTNSPNLSKNFMKKAKGITGNNRIS